MHVISTEAALPHRAAQRRASLRFAFASGIAMPGRHRFLNSFSEENIR
jgi:hypothetical protein